MSDTQATRIATRIMKHGFSLIEILVILGVLAILSVLSVPAVTHLVRADEMNRAVLAVQQELTNARQAAISQNKRVELRLYEYDDPRRPGTTNQFKALQLFLIRNDGSAEPLGRPVYLPGNVVMNTSVQLSPILNDANLNKVYSSSSPVDPQISLPNVGTAYTAKAVQFRPNGSVNVQSGEDFLTIHPAPTDSEHSKSALDDTITDFAVFQISPVNGTARLYRP